MFIDIFKKGKRFKIIVTVTVIIRILYRFGYICMFGFFFGD
jgi:hypothetical protein